VFDIGEKIRIFNVTAIYRRSGEAIRSAPPVLFPQSYTDRTSKGFFVAGSHLEQHVNISLAALLKMTMSAASLTAILSTTSCTCV
jgi:hypothetical protein